MSNHTSGPHRGHAAGDTDIEKQASQLASDVKYKVKQKMGAHTDMNPAQVVRAYLAQLASSPAPGPVKALAKKKLSGGVKEEYGIADLAKQSTVNALVKVFVEGVTVEEEVEDISEADEKKYWVVVTDKKTGNTYRRQATRAKIAELRSNPNIRRVEMTGYHPKETDDKQGQKTSKVKSGKGLDPVGKEDADLNNNGVKNDKSDKYLLKRRAAVGKAIANRTGLNASFDLDGEVVNEAKKAKKKNDTITGEGVNNSKYINTTPTMEQTDAKTSGTKPSEEEKNKIKMRQKQVQLALMRQRQTMQLQRSGRLPLNYSDDYTPEGEDIQEVSPPGFEGTVKAMKKHPELSRGKTPEGKDKNIYALAWFMKNKGFKSHKTASGKDKIVSHYEPEGALVDEAKVDAGKTDKEKRSIRTARQGYAGVTIPNSSLHTGDVSRRAAHRDRDEMNKDMKDVRRGRTDGPQFQGQTGRERLEKVKKSLQKNSFDPQGEQLDELNRVEKKTGINTKTGRPTAKGGMKDDKAFTHVKKMIRNMEGTPAGQRKKVPGKKPPVAGEYGAPQSPAQKIALKRAAQRRSQEFQNDTRGT